MHVASHIVPLRARYAKPTAMRRMQCSKMSENPNYVQGPSTAQVELVGKEIWVELH